MYLYLNKILFALNSEDPDEKPQNGAFHQGLYCLLKQMIFRERNTILFVISAWIYTMYHLKFIV